MEEFYARELEAWKRRISKLDIDETLKKAILDFDMEAINLKAATRASYLKCLRLFALNMHGKRVDEIGKEDLIRFFDEIRGKYSERLIELTKITIKKFFKQRNGGVYPDFVIWVKPMRNNHYKLPEELLTEDEIRRIVDACPNIRDKAFLMVLYESGCRLGEMLSMKLKHVNFDEFGAVVVVSGKTGSRRLRLIFSAPDLKSWINSHPIKDDLESYLWVCMKRNFGKRLDITWLQHRVKQLATKAGIKKRVHCHLFRHTRITQYAKMGFGEAEIRILAGWTGSSKMAAVYIHLSGADVEEKYLRLHGKLKKPMHLEEPLIKVKTCPRCNNENSPMVKICEKCWLPLDLKTVIKLEQQRKQADYIMNLLYKRPRFQKVVEEELVAIEQEKAGEEVTSG